MKKTIFILLALISIAGCNNDLKPKELEKGYIEGLQEKKKKAEDAAEEVQSSGVEPYPLVELLMKLPFLRRFCGAVLPPCASTYVFTAF